MLIDPFFKGMNLGEVKRLYAGVYQIYHWNFELVFRGTQNYELDFPRLKSDFNCYGVCDSPEQLMSKLPKEVTDSVTPYVISMVQIRKEYETEQNWRWHKWGEYIGDQSPQCEYLFDEPEIEEVWTYHIYQLEAPEEPLT